MYRTAIVGVLAALALCGGGYGQTKAPGPKPAAKPGAKSALDKPTLEAYLRHTFMMPAALKVMVEDPKPSDVPGMVSVDVMVTDGGPMKQQVQFLVSKDGTKILQGKVFDVRESPFAPDLKLIHTEGAANAGPPQAPVTMVVFSDFQCQFCKEAAKTLRTNLEKNYPTQVRMVFKDFPLEQIHPWAKPAAMIGRCVQKINPGAFWEYHDWIFEKQAEITVENVKTKSLDFANSKGLDSLQMTQCIDGKVTQKEVEKTMEEARALQIGSTPTVFVNGRRLVGNSPWEQFQAVIDYELNYAQKTQTAKKAEEACCEVKLAIPVK